MNLNDLASVPANINSGVRSAKQQTMLALLGNPRSSYDVDCQPVTNPTLKKLIVLQDVGPFRVTGLKPAVEDLRKIFADVKASNAELYSALGTAGMFCCRLVRGTKTGAISNHSWGTAIDLKINDVLDRRGDGKVLQGLVDLAPYFNKQGWFWGADFGTEDGMHFEVGDERIREFHKAGLFDRTVAMPQSTLSIGDRGPEVRHLQKRLNSFGAEMKVDGIFGPATHAAVIAFQADKGLTPDGIVGPKTAKALDL
ncbi:D-alanyl-D-alanine carboxypeptidase [Nitrosomonas marina]|uniref:D-alanyl-D-alanine carboxypeptidase n=1 Tax=Nitrosomonas marina TaxID=917 RepID=A0A1I0F6C1_9PROT|nr:peptidoglycan-binding protein [Nitrosomonas marina]SET52631.1 D-alanyl-D-alanine carboxypeptidase [Nitrosomonas marina]